MIDWWFTFFKFQRKSDFFNINDLNFQMSQKFVQPLVWIAQVMVGVNNLKKIADP